MSLAAIPSPPSPTLTVGPLMIHYYALFVVLGVAVAAVITARRWAARGGQPGIVGDVLLVAVPVGLVGARLYHVATSWQLFFGAGAQPWRAVAVWEGGLGVWGGIAGGALGAWLVCRRRGVRFAAFADAAAVGVPVGQAVGRIGCYFNQELYGRPTDLPWAIVIDPARRPADTPQAGTYHPTFAYEALWNLGVAGLVLWAERRFRLGPGRAFAVYVAGYTAGRAWIETLRVDPANQILGLRLNVWTSLLLFTAAAVFLLLPRRPRHPAGEATSVQQTGTSGSGDAGSPPGPAPLATTAPSDHGPHEPRPAKVGDHREPAQATPATAVPSPGAHGLAPSPAPGTRPYHSDHA